MGSNPFELDIVKKNFQKLRDIDLPMRLANLGQNFFAASWRKQGWDDGGVHPWAEVKRRTPGTKANKYAKPSAKTRAILVQSGRLRRAVQDSVKEITFNRIRFIVDVPYAGYLNDCTPDMPARPFMKDSETLSNLVIKKIEQTVDEIWKK